MKIIDKADWQIDGGIKREIVVNHFRILFNWLESNNLLTEEGIEIFELGIDESISLHSRLITSKALEFLEAKYDEYLREYPYGTDNDLIQLKKLYSEFS